MRTPWGTSDHQHTYLPGVTFYGTPSHGGFKLSAKREAELDAKLRAHGITAEQARMGYPRGWYEEDCCAYAVMFAFWDTRPADMTAADALNGLRRWL